jgi:hypothetical protein
MLCVDKDLSPPDEGATEHSQQEDRQSQYHGAYQN